MISFNIETLSSGKSPPLEILLIKFDVAIANFKNLLNTPVIGECLNITDIEKVG